MHTLVRPESDAYAVIHHYQYSGRLGLPVNTQHANKLKCRGVTGCLNLRVVVVSELGTGCVGYELFRIHKTKRYVWWRNAQLRKRLMTKKGELSHLNK